MNYINNQFTFSLLKLKKYKRNNQGFTLIELLVVIIILGILAAIALPNFLGQVGKSRETEGKNDLGTIGRSQHAYHFEKQIFADQVDKLNISGINNSRYFSFPDPAVANQNIVRHQAIAKNATSNRIRNYAVGVYHNSGLFNSVLCQGNQINDPVDAPNTPLGNCTNSGIKLE